jgi:hypothetical protein
MKKWGSRCTSCCPKTAPANVRRRSGCPCGFGELMMSRFEAEFFVARGIAATTHGDGVCTPPGMN